MIIVLILIALFVAFPLFIIGGTLLSEAWIVLYSPFETLSAGQPAKAAIYAALIYGLPACAWFRYYLIKRFRKEVRK